MHVGNDSKLPSTLTRRMVKSVAGDVVSIYGDWPDGVLYDYVVAELGAIRWRFTSPEIGLSGDFDRVVKLEAFAIAHGRAKESLPVDVTMETIGEMGDRTPDSQQWRVDFCERTISRKDGRSTGLRGASVQMSAEGPRSPALVKGVRVETVRAAR